MLTPELEDATQAVDPMMPPDGTPVEGVGASGIKDVAPRNPRFARRIARGRLPGSTPSPRRPVQNLRPR